MSQLYSEMNAGTEQGMAKKGTRERERDPDIKRGLEGTTITEKDAREIIDGVQTMYDRIPGIFRPMIPPLPEVLRRIPTNAQKYTLREIIELLDYAYKNGLLKR